MNNITVGLIKGRHQLPVDGYIFDEAISDVHDYAAIRRHVADWIAENVGITRRNFCIGLNQSDGNDVECFCGENELTVYVTGLTAVTAEVIRCCAINGVSLTLMHFDSVTGGYRKQCIF